MTHTTHHTCRVSEQQRYTFNRLERPSGRICDLPRHCVVTCVNSAGAVSLPLGALRFPLAVQQPVQQPKFKLRSVIAQPSKPFQNRPQAAPFNVFQWPFESNSGWFYQPMFVIEFDFFR